MGGAACGRPACLAGRVSALPSAASASAAGPRGGGNNTKTFPGRLLCQPAGSGARLNLPQSVCDCRSGLKKKPNK